MRGAVSVRDSTSHPLSAELPPTFLLRRPYGEPHLPEEDRLFSLNGTTVWVMDDVQAITVLYPDEY